MPARPAAEDYLPFDHPVRDLPRLLAGLERARQRPAGGSYLEDLEDPEDTEDADAGIRRWRLRRRQLTLLLIAAVVFLMLSVAGGQSGYFIRHLPLLIFAGILVLAGTAPPVSRRTPWRRDPLRRGVAGVLTLSGAAAVLVVVTYLVPAWAGLATGLYLSLGTLALFFAIRGGWSASRSAPAPAFPPPQGEPWPEPAAGADPSRAAVLQACREALEQIGANAPRGAEATGWLDLSAPEKPGQRVWWRLRLPWEAGARLRLAGLDEAPKDTGDGGRIHRLLATLAVDPRRWRTEPGGTRNATFGLLTVEAFEVTPSRVSIRVLSPERAFRPYDLIEMLKALEERVHPVDPAVSPADPGETPA